MRGGVRWGGFGYNILSKVFGTMPTILEIRMPFDVDTGTLVLAKMATLAGFYFDQFIPHEKPVKKVAVFCVISETSDKYILRRRQKEI